MEFTITYVYAFAIHLWLTSPLLVMMASLIVALGLIVGKLEKWPHFDAIYWAFVTATTVGYGDLRPKSKPSRVLAILIAFIGVTFTGLVVALAINSASLSFEQVMDVKSTTALQ